MTETLFELFALYGVPVVFATLLVGAIGVPLPSTLLLLSTGALLAQGDIDATTVFAAAATAAILGDQIGYQIGRRAGVLLESRYGGNGGIAANLAKARAFSRKWGGPGVFFSRWLVSPVGPWINITSGMAAYPWARFTAWGVAGEIVWVILFLGMGYGFSRSIEDLATLTSNLSWLILGIAATAFLGYRVRKALNEPARKSKEPPEGGSSQAI